MLELLKFVTDPKDRIRQAFAYLGRVHQDQPSAQGWSLQLWNLIHGKGWTNICRCDLKDMKAMSARYGLWMHEGKFVTLDQWAAILERKNG